jgi:hypothetical protein
VRRFNQRKAALQVEEASAIMGTTRPMSTV